MTIHIGTSAVAYATGADAPGCDSGRAALLRPVAVVVAGDPSPHLFTPYPEGAPPELPGDHLHPVVGVDHRVVLPASVLFGAAFLIGCDLVARTVLAPVEVPVGVVTAAVGAPLFLALLVHRRRELAGA